MSATLVIFHLSQDNFNANFVKILEAITLIYLYVIDQEKNYYFAASNDKNLTFYFILNQRKHLYAYWSYNKIFDNVSSILLFFIVFPFFLNHTVLLFYYY